MVQPSRPQMKICSMRITCWITKTTNTHSEYVTPIPFPLQQCLQNRASLLRFTYIVCLLYFYSSLLKIICSPLYISKLSVLSPYNGQPQTRLSALFAFGTSPDSLVVTSCNHGKLKPQSDTRRSVTPTTSSYSLISKFF
jgi:hypothetical protein